MFLAGGSCLEVYEKVTVWSKLVCTVGIHENELICVQYSSRVCDGGVLHHMSMVDAHCG